MLSKEERAYYEKARQMSHEYLENVFNEFQHIKDEDLRAQIIILAGCRPIGDLAAYTASKSAGTPKEATPQELLDNWVETLRAGFKHIDEPDSETAIN